MAKSEHIKSWEGGGDQDYMGIAVYDDHVLVYAGGRMVPGGSNRYTYQEFVEQELKPKSFAGYLTEKQLAEAQAYVQALLDGETL